MRFEGHLIKISWNDRPNFRQRLGVIDPEEEVNTNETDKICLEFIQVNVNKSSKTTKNSA